MPRGRREILVDLLASAVAGVEVLFWEYAATSGMTTLDPTHLHREESVGFAMSLGKHL